MNFYISDTHFGHKKIISLCNRPFNSVEEMDSAIIKKWNRRVSKNDTVYFLGDFSFYDHEKTLEIIQALNGKKVFIKGNHDKAIEENEIVLTIRNYLEIIDGDRKVVLFHYPIYEWAGYYKSAIHLYGHIHNNRVLAIKNAYNVCAEVQNYEPKTLDEILSKDSK